MSDTQLYSSDVAFTPAVKAIQALKGSREAYADVEKSGGWRTEIDEKLGAFLAEATSFYLAPPPARTGSPISSIAAVRRGLSKSSTRTRSPLPTTAATGNTSPRATSRKIRRRISL